MLKGTYECAPAQDHSAIQNHKQLISNRKKSGHQRRGTKLGRRHQTRDAWLAAWQVSRKPLEMSTSSSSLQTKQPANQVWRNTFLSMEAKESMQSMTRLRKPFYKKKIEKGRHAYWYAYATWISQFSIARHNGPQSAPNKLTLMGRI